MVERCSAEVPGSTPGFSTIATSGSNKFTLVCIFFFSFFKICPSLLVAAAAAAAAASRIIRGGFVTSLYPVSFSMIFFFQKNLINIKSHNSKLEKKKLCQKLEPLGLPFG